MRRLWWLHVGLAIGTQLGCSDDSPPRDETMTTSQGTQYLAHEVVVRRMPGVDDALFRRHIRLIGGKIVDDKSLLASDLGYFRVELPTSTTADQAISRLVAAGAAERADRNYVIDQIATPSDPYYGQLWGMAKIGAPKAWDLTTGSSEVVVVVSDTGVDFAHPDLAANAWRNDREVPGNGKDDDQNGHVDDVGGWDWVNSDNNPTDDHGHGTHVAGTIGAVGNDGYGVAGVNWKVRIVALKILSAGGSGTLWNGAQSILYSARIKARVVNASWGCTGCYANYLEDAIRTLGEAGGLFVAAAGNNGTDNDSTPHYPSSHVNPNVVAVAATDSSDNMAYFSNYGATSVDLAAPGVGILSTLPGGKFASWNGTSMATPHVAGAVALYLAMRPSATHEEVKARLLSTVTPLTVLKGKMVSGGRLSVERLLTEDSMPPAAPTGVSAVAGARSDVTVSWNASPEKDVAMYRVRLGTAPGDYPQSRDVPKTETSTRIEGLQNGTRTFFVVHAIDGAGNMSPASAEVSATPKDGTSPPQVVDLAAAPVPGEPTSGFVVSASGEFSDYYAAEHAFDGSPDTTWITPPRPAPQEEQVVALLNKPYFIDRVELLPSAAYPEFFPVDFDIDVSKDGAAWTTVGGMRNAQASPFEPQVIVFSPTWGESIRLRVLKSYEHPSGFFYSGLSELLVREVSGSPDALALTFTAPGDDPGEGKAERYDIRRSGEPIDEASFATGVSVTGPIPKAAGLQETVLASGLAYETRYYFALKAHDEAGNVSPLSNVASAQTVVMPPSTVGDLAVAATGDGSVTLTWTAPGGDGAKGQAARYELRHAEVPLTAGNFPEATLVEGVARPAAAGSTETHQITGLVNGRLIYFALRAIDNAGAAGGLSNVVAAKPQDGPDAVPPEAVRDLSAQLSIASVKRQVTALSASSGVGGTFGAGKIVDGSLATNWLVGGGARDKVEWFVVDLAAVEPLVKFRIHPSTVGWYVSFLPEDFEIQVSIDQLNWTPVVHVEGLAGRFADWLEYGIPVTHARYVRFYVTKHGPSSPNTNPVACCWYTSLAEFETYTLTPSLEADLTWVAPGDDGYVATAAAYDVRRALAPITDENFSSATQVPSKAPLPGGSLELLRVPDLELEETHTFALKARDEAGLTSGLSNVASLKTPGVPPSPITDLVVVKATVSSVELAFTATGDDGAVGTATSYDLRFSREPVTPESWDRAFRVAGIPAPKPSGERETLLVSGLASNTVYYLAIKGIDDWGQSSLLSNVVAIETLDGVAPNAVTDLVAAPVDPRSSPPLAMRVVESSGAYSPDTEADNLVDGDPGTAWVSAGSAQAGTEMVRFDLGGERRLGRLRLLGASGYLDLFPEAFRLEVKASATSDWKPVVVDSGLSTTGDWEEWQIGAVLAVQARLVVTKTRPWAGKYYTALAEVQLHEDPTDYSRVRLAWTAPGDDGDKGTAARYEIRRKATPLAEDTWSDGVGVDAPVPQPAGYLERLEVAGLAPETTYCFALRAEDERANRSALSNSPCTKTPGLPPSTITDLAVARVGATSVGLTWTAPGADGVVGQAAAYELRMSSSRIHASNWGSAIPVEGLPKPEAAGTPQQYDVTGLNGLTTYYFALRAVDSSGIPGVASNNAIATTLDDVPPAAISDLVATTNTSAWGSLILSWTAPGDNGQSGQASRYDLRVSRQPITPDNYASANAIPISSPKPAGQGESVKITGLDPEALIYVALKAVDAEGNASRLSNVALARTRDEVPSQVTDLSAAGSGSTSLVLKWTAPGDDGAKGTATSYEIRTSTSPITESLFSMATKVASPPVPAPGGSAQEFVLDGLSPGRTYYVALKAVDDRGNVSPMSNVASAATPDQVPPAKVTDLVAKTGPDLGTIRLEWTAPGDDEWTGRVAAIDLRWSYNPIAVNHFEDALPVQPEVSVVDGGQVQVHVARSLPSETRLYFALRARDDSGNWSGVSNDASAWTKDVPPAAVYDLKQSGRSANGITISWTAPGDDEFSGTAEEYDIRVSTSPIDAESFDKATKAVAPKPKTGLSPESWTISGLDPNVSYYVALKARDDRHNWSSISNVVSARTADTLPPAQVADLLAEAGSLSGSIQLSWTAPGDDGAVGTAARYELRRALEPVTEKNWASATTVLGLEAPRSSGTKETFLAAGLEGETTYHFAIRAVDDEENAGPLSPSTSASTPPIPPSQVTNLFASASAGAVTLTWTAPGDDRMTGTATEYDVRFATSVVTAASYAQATQATGEPKPQPAFSSEKFTITGLAESTTYYFALKTIDDAGAVSGLSNVVKVTTPDQTAPAMPGALAAKAPQDDGTPVEVTAAEASSVLGPSWVAENVIDFSETSSWSSEGSPFSTADWLSVDLKDRVAIDRIGLRPDALYYDLFPRDFTLEVSDDRASWTAVVVEEEFRASNAEWLQWGFSPFSGKYVRLVTSDTATSYARHYAVVAEVEVYKAAPSDGRVQLTWIAPGDDGQSGTAKSYQVFRSQAPFTESTVGSATKVSGAPTPQAAGALQAMLVTGLPGETTYYWAVRAVDEAGNVGALSSVVSASSNPVPPAATWDLFARARGQSEVDLTWTAPGDDGLVGTAASYELRHAPWPITSQNFPLATLVSGTKTPSASGSLESMRVSGLAPGTLHRFALVARDEAGNASYLSNVALVTTDPAPDTTPPVAVSTLNARLPVAGGQPIQARAAAWSSEQAPDFTAAALVDGSIGTLWSSAARSTQREEWVRIDLGSAVRTDRVRAWPAEGYTDLFPPSFEIRVSPDGLAWSLVLGKSGTSASPGKAVEATFATTAVRYVELRATELARHENGLFYAIVAELEALTAQEPPGTVLVSFTAPGDDGTSGRASEYDLRVGACPFDFDSAKRLSMDAPLAAGSPERVTVTSVPKGEACFGVVSIDDAGNRSALSNTAKVAVP